MQPGRRTVQGVVEDALQTVLRLEQAPRTTVAGRTDAGVHARGQVCHVDLSRESTSDLALLQRRLGGVLPEDVTLHAVSVAPDGFDARFAACWRRYVYRVADGPVDPLRRHVILRWGHPLDVGAMAAASVPLLGEHDFAAFCRPREGASTVRTLLDLTWRRGEDGVVEAEVRADAFCHSMVRALVGALLAVGEGRRGTGWPAEVLEATVRDPRVRVAPARGLTLEQVGYPPVEEMGTRVGQARRFRG